MTEINCPHCDGAGAIQMETHWATCPDCDGSGRVSRSSAPKKDRRNPWMNGDFAFICENEECGRLFFWQGDPQQRIRFQKILRDCSCLVCPNCGHDHEIDEGVRRMLT